VVVVSFARCVQLGGLIPRPSRAGRPSLGKEAACRLRCAPYHCPARRSCHASLGLVQRLAVQRAQMCPWRPQYAAIQTRYACQQPRQREGVLTATPALAPRATYAVLYLRPARPLHPDLAGSFTRVYVHNLPWQLTNDELLAHMSTAGTVRSANIMTRHDGRSKGCA
jgi:hypothetical protein